MKNLLFPIMTWMRTIEPKKVMFSMVAVDHVGFLTIMGKAQPLRADGDHDLVAGFRLADITGGLQLRAHRCG